MGKISEKNRSYIMSRVRSKDTTPEIAVRQIVFSLGYRYRLHYSKLPGKPDLAFPGRKKVIFVHGCFWHQHPKCKIGKPPKSNLEFWVPKLERNLERDRHNKALLRKLGWRVLVIRECHIHKSGLILKKIEKFLE